MPRRTSNAAVRPSVNACTPDSSTSIDNSSSIATPIVNPRYTQLLSRTLKHANAPSGEDRLCLRSISPSLDCLRSVLTETAPSGERVTDYSKIPRSHPQFMNDLLHFAFSQRSPEDLEHTITALASCTCKQDDFVRWLHEDKRVVGADSTKLLKLLCRIIFDAINAVYESAVDIPELVKSKKRGCRKPKDAGYRSWVHFLLENEVAMVESMVTWYVVTSEVAVLQFVSTVESLAMIGRRQLGCSDIDSYFHRCPLQLTRLFEAIMSKLMLAVDAAVRNRQPMDRYDAPIDGLLTSILKLIYAMSDIPESLSNAYVIAADEDIRAAIRVVESADFSFPGGSEDRRKLRSGLHEDMCAIAKVLEQRGLPLQPNPFDVAVESGHERCPSHFDSHCPCEGPYSDVFFTIMWVKGMTTCMNACCRRPASGKPFSVCAGCRLYSYCSRECQREAWSNNHKPICKDVGKLVACWGTTFEELCKNIRPGRDRDMFVGCSHVDDVLRRLLVEKGVELVNGVEDLGDHMQDFQDRYYGESDVDSEGEEEGLEEEECGEGGSGESDVWNEGTGVDESLYT